MFLQYLDASIEMASLVWVIHNSNYFSQYVFHKLYLMDSYEVVV